MATNISLSKLPWYGQVGTFAVLSLALVGAFWYVEAAPKREEIEARLATLSTLRQDINRGLQTARRLPDFRREVAQLEGQLDRLRLVLPEDQDVAELLRRVQAMATQSNLTIRGFSPQAVKRQQQHAEWPFGLQLEGTYHDLGGFLERVSKFPRIINVGEIKIRARDAQATGRATVTAECTATTFVLVEPAAAATPAPAPAAGA